MAKGHIRLGASVATLREYMTQYERYRKVQVNPYSAKLSTGGDAYDDLGPWAYYVEQDWQAGVGKNSEGEGGVLFSTAETRVPNRIMLSSRLLQYDDRTASTDVDDWRNLGLQAMTGSITLSATGTSQRIAIRMGGPTASSPEWVASFYGIVPAGTVVKVRWLDGATISTATALVTHDDYSDAAGDDRPMYRWHTVGLKTGSVSTPEWLEIYPTTGSMTLACTSTWTSATTPQIYNGSSWSAATGTAIYPIVTTNWRAMLTPSGTSLLQPCKAIVRFNNAIYAGMGIYLCKFDGNEWARIGATAQTITDLAVFGSTLYIGQESGVFYTCNTSDSISAGASDGKFFTVWNGYLNRASNTQFWYTGDGTNWTGPITVGHSGATVTGMAGALDLVYVATTEALYYMAPGGIMRGITRWGSGRASNGAGLLNHQGALYAIVNGGVAQIQVSEGQASILPIWLSREDDLVAGYLQQPVALCSTNNWLVALVQQTAAPTRSSAWCWTGQGWHCVAEFPLYICDALYLDGSSLWTGSRAGVFFVARFNDYTINPLRDTAHRFNYTAWVETPWINGGLVDVEKDFESVYISGEELAAGQTVTVFWKVRGGTWQELGTVDADGEELRWSNYATRPAAKEIKLGFRLFSNSLTASPTIEAIRLKYRPNVTDRWQWNLILPFHNDQEMLDGDLNPYTGAQMVAHLEGLVKQTQPFFMEDVDGTQYEVVCTGYDLNIEKFEHYKNTKRPHWIAQVTLEQSYAA